MNMVHRNLISKVNRAGEILLEYVLAVIATVCILANYTAWPKLVMPILIIGLICIQLPYEPKRKDIVYMLGTAIYFIGIMVGISSIEHYLLEGTIVSAIGLFMMGTALWICNERAVEFIFEAVLGLLIYMEYICIVNGGFNISQLI